MKMSVDMLKVFNLMTKYGVSAYELIGFVTTGLEHKIDLCDYEDDEKDNEVRDKELLESLNKLSWKVKVD